MRLSVIIPALNEAAVIVQAVAAAWSAGADEVVVADGGSSDGTDRVCAGLACRFLACPPGRGPQQNAAAEQATGDWLLFLHADCRFVGPIREQIETAVHEGAQGLLVFRQQIEAPGWRYRALEQGNAARVRWLGLPYGDQGFCLPRETFFQLGRFPAEPLMEDVALAARARRLGWPALLPGPLLVSPRRWQRQGVVWQTLRNWLLLSLWLCGVSPRRLAPWYPRHDQNSSGRR